MKIVTVAKAAPWVVEGLNALLAQLSESVSHFSINELEHIVASDCATLLVALEAEHVMGSLTLVIFRIPTGIRVRSKMWWWTPPPEAKESENCWCAGQLNWQGTEALMQSI